MYRLLYFFCFRSRELFCVTLSKIHGVVSPLDVEICIRGNFTNSNLKNSHAERLTHIFAGHCLKKCIASKWKSDVQNPNWNVALRKSVAAPHGEKKHALAEE